MRLLISNFSRIGPAKAGQNYPRGEHALTKKILRRISSTLPRTSRLKQGTASKKKSANKRAPGRNTSATWQIRCCARPASSIPTFRLLQLTFGKPRRRSRPSPTLSNANGRTKYSARHRSSQPSSSALRANDGETSESRKFSLTWA